MSSQATLQTILEQYQNQLKSWSFTSWHLRTLHAIRKCRTQALGGHIDQCNCCKKIHISYNSCRNRHCPKCQGHKRQEWITARQKELLNTSYFHVVFTLPDTLNCVALNYSNEVYSALFKASWLTLKQFGEQEFNAQVGMISVLHTWGQNLSLHPHLHCIVPAGGVRKNGTWKASKKRKFLFPVKAMSLVFRAKMVAELRKKKLPISKEEYGVLFSKNWVVYAKQAFGKPEYVVEYLGRYTHKIAISDARIMAHNRKKNTVYFSAKNYKKEGKKEVLSLSAKDFIRRFQMHILPKGFTRIRHFGILSSTWKRKKLPKLQQELGGNLKHEIKKKETLHKRCNFCKKGKLILIESFGVRGPPKKYLNPKTTKS